MGHLLLHESETIVLCLLGSVGSVNLCVTVFCI